MTKKEMCNTKAKYVSKAFYNDCQNLEKKLELTSVKH